MTVFGFLIFYSTCFPIEMSTNTYLMSQIPVSSLLRNRLENLEEIHSKKQPCEHHLVDCPTTRRRLEYLRPSQSHRVNPLTPDKSLHLERFTTNFLPI